MGFLSRLFHIWDKKQSPAIMSPECTKILQLKNSVNDLLSQNRYISHKEITFLKNEAELISFFDTLKKSDMFLDYCRKNNFSDEDIRGIDDTIDIINDIENIVEHINEKYVNESQVSEKEYLDNILKDVDPNISLDDDQRKVVLTDEDNCLVIAGAGAGKTTTVAAKVKYLVEKQNVDPKQILVISFTNKAVSELKDKINKSLKLECPIATFHSTGNAILRKQNPEKLKITDEWTLYNVIQNYFKTSLLKNERMVNNLVLFFASYFDTPYDGNDLTSFFNNIAKSNLSTMKSELEDFRTEVIDIRQKKAVTIQSEVLRSQQEVIIANFLYLNGIDYKYEPIYQYNIQNARKPYTPDFVITQGDKIAYIEHFGITESGQNNIFNKDQLETYKKAINDKIRLHREHGTTLIYTFSHYNDERSIEDHLREKLLENGFELSPRSNQEVIEKLVSSEESRYIRRLVFLLCRFINNFKTNGYNEADFDRMYHSTTNVRSKLFLDICNECYLEYQRFLQENDEIDFQDMINESARLLLEVKEMKQKLDFKYIIVDEYQDISRQRFDLVKALSEVTDAKIIAVGDDWQSIYAFSGSDVSLFLKFKESVGYAKELKIVKTYRNAQEVIDIAGGFIQQNPAQIKKVLESPKHITDPVIIYTYDGSPKKSEDSYRNGPNYRLAKAVETSLTHIIMSAKEEGKQSPGSVLILGRFGFDGDKLEKSGLFEYVDYGNKLRSVKYPKLNMTFMTAHASKGLGYDNVIVINGKNELYGFPSKIEDDPVLSFVIKGDHSIDYAEERRLFYVAMTRTKNRVYFIAPEHNPSEFLLEIKKEYKNVSLKGNWSEENPKLTNKKTCPICGFPMQYKYKNAYGLRLFICTNEPEICGFMTNEYNAGKLSICKCEKCRDGYLIVRPSKDTYFLGCTNFEESGTGCRNTLSAEEYYKMMKYPLTDLPKRPVREKRQVPTRELVNNPQETSVLPQDDTENINVIENDDGEVIYNNIPLRKTVIAVSNCLERISKVHFFGIVMLTDVLRGIETDRIKKYMFSSVPEFGVLENISRDNVSSIIQFLIDNDFILLTKGTYPVLHPTYNSRNLNETLTRNTLKKLATYLSKE